MKLPSDEKEIVSENDEDRLDEQNVPEDGERCSNPKSVAVAMKTTMSSESETKNPTFLLEHLNCSGIQ